MLTPNLAWIAAISGALALAAAAPSETNVMGRLPSLTAKHLEQHRIEPSPIPGGRTLALVAFDRTHRSEIRSWIDGLRLNQDSAIAWFKMPVLKDPGSERARSDIESRLQAGHGGAGPHARVVPIFTNPDDFIRAAGLSGKDHASVLVLNRDGRVLARAEGQFDEAKAQALRETLLAQRVD